jgi:hypothetical protein
MTDAEYRPFVVERPGPDGRIKLGPEAKYWAEQHGMSLTEMARYLLQQHEAQQEDRILSGGFSESIEDRRDESFVPDKTAQQIWGAYPHDAAPHAQTFGPNPLANALGFGDVGNQPAPAPQVMGPTAPQWPPAFGTFNQNK